MRGEERAVGIVLAGGVGHRLGGGKALAPLAGKPLLGHVIERLRPQVDALWLSARREQASLSAFGIPVIADAGPVRSVAAALVGSLAEALSHDRVAVSVPCDTPFLPRDLRVRLEETLNESGAVGVVVRAGGRVHPAIGVWSMAAIDPIRACVAKGEHKMQRICEAIGVAVHEAATSHWPEWHFLNVNTPTDLDQARARADWLAARFETA